MKHKAERISVVVKTFLKTRDQERDLGVKVLRPRLKPWHLQQYLHKIVGKKRILV